MRAQQERAAVIGAGPIGCVTAAHLSKAGYSVALCDADGRAIEQIQRAGGIQLSGVRQGKFSVDLATTDAAQAVRDAKLIVSAVPASAHEAVARAVAADLPSHCTIVFQPGQTLSAVAFMYAAKAAGYRGQPTLVETLNTLFTARLHKTGQVDLYAVKRHVPYAVLPADRREETAVLLEALFDNLVPASCMLEIDLHNFNAILHPPITLLNAGPIDAGRAFLYYMDGATPAVMKLVESLEGERLAILAALGLPAMPLIEWFDRVYGVKRDKLLEAVLSVGPYAKIQAPPSLDTRLLLEDIPCGLVGYCSIAERAGVHTPIMRSVVDVCSAMYQIDFWKSGRTLSRLGISEAQMNELSACK